MEVKIKNITDKAIFADLDSGLTGMIPYKEISYNESDEDLKKFKKNQIIKVKIVDIKDDKDKILNKSIRKRSNRLV